MEIGKKYKIASEAAAEILTCIGRAANGNYVVESSLDSTLFRISKPELYVEYKEPKNFEKYINIYPNGYVEMFRFRKDAKEAARSSCIASIEINYTEGQGLECLK